MKASFHLNILHLIFSRVFSPQASLWARDHPFVINRQSLHQVIQRRSRTYRPDYQAVAALVLFRHLHAHED